MRSVLSRNVNARSSFVRGSKISTQVVSVPLAKANLEKHLVEIQL